MKPSELYGPGVPSPRTAALLAEADKIHDARIRRQDAAAEMTRAYQRAQSVPPRVVRDSERPPSLSNRGLVILWLTTLTSSFAGIPCLVIFSPPLWVSLLVLVFLLFLVVACMADTLERV